MKMTDEKLLEIFLAAADKKAIVFDLADANECDIWEMATHLKEIGAAIKLNTFNKFNPKRGGQEDGGKIEYLKTIIKRQDEEIKRLNTENKTLKESLQYDEEVIVELRNQIEVVAIPPERDEETEQLLNEQRDKIEYLQQQVNEGVRKFNELYRQLNEQEDINCFDMSDLINRFCDGLYGVDAYLTGRIVETLYRWRFSDANDQLLLLPGLLEKLTNLIFDKTEETT